MKTKFATQTCHTDEKQNLSHTRKYVTQTGNLSCHTDAKTKLATQTEN